MFCRKPKVLEVFKRRLWWTGRTEAHRIARTGDGSRRSHDGYPPEVAASTSTRGSI
jgi:hypothetical protein